MAPQALKGTVARKHVGWTDAELERRGGGGGKSILGGGQRCVPSQQLARTRRHEIRKAERASIDH